MWSNIYDQTFWIFHFLCGFGFFTHTKLKHKSKIKNKNNAYKEMQDTKNAQRYDIQCMTGPTKIERIWSRTKRAKAQP